MSFDKKNSVKFASAVLTGALVLGGAYSVAAETPDSKLETEAVEAEAKEKVVFLCTKEKEEEKSRFAEQAVHSLEEALAQFEDQEEKKEEDPAKFELIQKEKKILVLCTGTELSDEEKKQVEENEISLMTEADYEAALKAKEEAAKKEAEKEIEKEEVVESEAVTETVVEETADQTTESFIWEKPQIPVDTPVKEETPQVPAEEEVKTEISKDQMAAADTAADQTTENKVTEEKNQETGVAAEKTEPVSAEAEEEEETEESEVVVYDLFALFGVEETVESVEEEEVVPAMLSAETADASDVNPMVEKEETSDPTEETPSVMMLPGIDLVGNGTSGVGGGSNAASKPATPSGSNTGSTTPGGNTSAGSIPSATPSAAPSGASQPAAGTPVSAGAGFVQTGDDSNRPFWGLSAGISAAMAAYFSAQWRRFRREEE